MPFSRMLLGVIVATLLALCAVLAINTLRRAPVPGDVPPPAPLAFDEQGAVARLSQALTYRTISWEAASPNDPALARRQRESLAAFDAFHAFLRDRFPHANAVLVREPLDSPTLWFTWPGTDPGAAPIALMAHQDVVPVQPGTERDWGMPPFSGAVHGGEIWGRGALDDKGNMMAILEAIDALAASGFRPRATVHVVFGHDEENGGDRGVGAIAAVWRARGVRPAFVLDEGPWMTVDALPGLDRRFALVGVAEKGIANLALHVAMAPGHASMPPRDTAIGTLARAIANVESHPMPARLEGAAAAMFDAIAPETRGLQRVVLSNRTLLAPLLRARLLQSPTTAAMLRTTLAPSVVRAGNKSNVLPARAEAIVNVRLLPGEDPDAVLRHVRESIDDPRVSVAWDGPVRTASRVSSADAPGFAVLARTIRQRFPGTVVAPGLVVGGTDSRHFDDIAVDVYRFAPFTLRTRDFSRYHGTGERIAVSDYLAMVRFHAQLLRNANDLATAGATPTHDPGP